MVGVVGGRVTDILSLAIHAHIQRRHLPERVLLDRKVCVHGEEEAVYGRLLVISLRVVALPVVLVLNLRRTLILSLSCHCTSLARRFHHSGVRLEVRSTVPFVRGGGLPVSHVASKGKTAQHGCSN